eukprot:5469007-Amphidinium_carterae.1
MSGAPIDCDTVQEAQLDGQDVRNLKRRLLRGGSAILCPACSSTALCDALVGDLFLPVEPMCLQTPTVAEPPAMLMVPTPVVCEAPPIACLPLCGGGSRKCRKLEPWSNAVEESKGAVLIVCRLLVETTPEASSFGPCIAAEPIVDAKMTITADKATATLRLRGRDFGRFVMWADAEKVDLINICESTAYSYCMSLRALAASLTSCDRFRKALAWPAHVVGWHVEPAALSSRRVGGAAVAR